MPTKKIILSLLAVLAFLGIVIWAIIQINGGLVAIYLQPNVKFDLAQAPPAPSYEDKNAWAAYPGRASYANFRPNDEAPASPSRLSVIDVFYIHPTSFIDDSGWNDFFDRKNDSLLNLSALRAQASAFNECCQIYAPRYRQATLWSFIGDEIDSYHALELAYFDIRRAWLYFLRQSRNRPFIIAGHSQGALHLMRLLQEEIAPNRNIVKRMIAAYLIGYAIPSDMNIAVSPCAMPTSLHCYINWNSVTKDYEGDFWRKTGRIWLDGRWQKIEGKKLVCVNPLSWRLNGGLVSAKFHKGGIVVKNFRQPEPPRLTPSLVSARCSQDGLLYISQPIEDYDLETVSNGGDYHFYDYHLFYQNLRENIDERIKFFFKEQTELPRQN